MPKTCYGTIGAAQFRMLLFYHSEENMPLWTEMESYMLKLPLPIYPETQKEGQESYD